jgi:hypothetical protein
MRCKFRYNERKRYLQVERLFLMIEQDLPVVTSLREVVLENDLRSESDEPTELFPSFETEQQRLFQRLGSVCQQHVSEMLSAGMSILYSGAPSA